ncbi:hypothetical protein AB0J80_00515 [Actinoplanes sp. NPDC049548]|uniref:hypothetical protein n=1 Tax=Actinoplanes sp. NPDC049548 TaxID=3155152 RepID=UPI00344AD47E
MSPIRRAAPDGPMPMSSCRVLPVEATDALRYAVGGRTRFRFDMSRPEDRSGPDAADVDAYLTDLPFGHDGDADWRVAGLAFAERVTGVRLPVDFPAWDMPGVLLDERRLVDEAGILSDEPGSECGNDRDLVECRRGNDLLNEGVGPGSDGVPGPRASATSRTPRRPDGPQRPLL